MRVPVYMQTGAGTIARQIRGIRAPLVGERVVFQTATEGARVCVGMRTVVFEAEPEMEVDIVEGVLLRFTLPLELLGVRHQGVGGARGPSGFLAEDDLEAEVIREPTTEGSVLVYRLLKSQIRVYTINIEPGQVATIERVGRR